MPELKNFLRMLQREEEEHVKQIVQRYALARNRMQETLAGSTPGWKDSGPPGDKHAPLDWQLVWRWPVILASKDPSGKTTQHLPRKEESKWENVMAQDGEGES